MIKAIAINDEPLALTVIQSLCNKSDSVELQKVFFTQPNQALQFLKKNPVNLIFCDIQMPAMTGIALGKSLQQQVMVIFTTAFFEFAAVSYELNAIDYLLKPINHKRFTQAMISCFLLTSSLTICEPTNPVAPITAIFQRDGFYLRDSNTFCFCCMG